MAKNNSLLLKFIVLELYLTFILLLGILGIWLIETPFRWFIIAPFLGIVPFYGSLDILSNQWINWTVRFNRFARGISVLKKTLILKSWILGLIIMTYGAMDPRWTFEEQEILTMLILLFALLPVCSQLTLDNQEGVRIVLENR